MAARKASQTAAGRRSESGSDAYVLLQRDHEKVQKLFKDFEKLHARESDADDLAALAQQICVELRIHAQVEEEIFYPALRDALDDEDLLDEAQVEHESAKALIAQIEEMGPDDEMFAARVTVLGEYINHHVREEQDEIFPAARKAKVDSAGLGEAMASRKSELQHEMGFAGDDEEASEDTEADSLPRGRRGSGNGSGRAAHR